MPITNFMPKCPSACKEVATTSLKAALAHRKCIMYWQQKSSRVHPDAGRCTKMHISGKSRDARGCTKMHGASSPPGELCPRRKQGPPLCRPINAHSDCSQTAFDRSWRGYPPVGWKGGPPRHYPQGGSAPSIFGVTRDPPAGTHRYPLEPRPMYVCTYICMHMHVHVFLCTLSCVCTQF